MDLSKLLRVILAQLSTETKLKFNQDFKAVDWLKVL